MSEVRFKRGTAAWWTTINPVLLSAEAGYERDTGKFKIGNGSSAWTALPYAAGGVTTLAGLSTPTITAADLVAALAASGLIAPIVTHGTDSTVARPAGASVVIWYGTADPAARLPQDIWTDAT